MTIVVAVDPDQDAGTVTNTASVEADEEDTVTANNTATAATTLVREIDLVTTKVNVSAPAPGQNVLYALTVTNNGPSSARSASVVDDLPPEVSFVSAISSSGCTLTSAPSEVTCALGTIQPGETIDVTIGASVPSNLADATELVNTASATADEGSSPVAEDRVLAERQVDLSIVKSADADPVAAGATMVYTLDVANAGPSDTTGASIVDTLPAGLTFLAGSSDGRCSGPAPTITCSGINVAAGGADSLDIAVSVPAGIAAGSTLTNSAVISPGTGEQDTNAANDTATVDTPVERTSALQVVKSDSTDPVIAGTTMSWTVAVTNFGPSIDNNVTLTDSLPSGVTFVSATGPCTETSSGSNVVSCAFGTLPVSPTAGSTVSTTITVDVADGLAAGTVLVNSATADGDASAPVVGTEQTTVDVSSDVTMTKTAPASVSAGDSYSYVVTVANDGPSDATGVIVTDILPPELTSDSWTATAGFATCSGSPLRCTPGSTAPDGQLAAGDSVVITIDVTADAATADGFALVNKATASASQPDPDLSNNVVSASSTSSRSADLAITKSNPAGPIPAGGIITYNLNVDNLGPSQASNVTITDPVPTGLTFNAAASSSGCAPSGPNVVCTIVTLDPSDPVAAFTLAFDVGSGLAGTTVGNTATVGATETDPVSGNDSATDTTSIYGEADLTLTKTSPAAPAVPGQTYRYELTASNDGPSNAVNAVISDTLPSGTSFVAGLSDSRCSAIGQTVTCAIGTLTPAPAAGSQDTVEITVMVESSATGTVANTATLASDTADPNALNNTETDVSPLMPQADLALVKTVASNTVNAGENVSYTLTASNSGPSDVPSYSVTDTLPSGLTFVAGSSSSACSAAGQVITCTDATAFPASAPARTFTVVASVAPNTADGATLVNRAEITSDVDEVDGSNNASSVPVTVNRASDLIITKSAQSPTAVAGDEVEFVLNVRNDGPSDATGVMISDTLPSDVVPLTAVPSGSVSCSVSDQTVTCGGPSLEAAESFDVTVRATVVASTPDNATPVNAAAVDAVEADPDGDNNNDTASVSVTRQSDIRLTKSSNSQPVATAGSSHLFELEVSNVGLSDVDGVVVTDTIPAGATFYAALSSGICSEPTAGTVTCAVGLLPAGAVADLVVAVQLDGSLADGSTLINSASATGQSNDVDLTNNSATASVSVERSADMAIVKQGPTAPVTAGTQVLFTLAVSNLGPSDADNITVTDTLPAGLTFVPGAPTDPRCSAAGQLVTCSEPGPMSADGTSTFQIAAVSSAGLPGGGTLTNEASVAADGQDPNDANNQSAVIIDFSRSSDLTVTKVDAADPAVAGEQLTYTIVALNDGPSVAANAVVTETLPTGATYVDALSDVRCDETPAAGSGVVTCAIGTLAVGSVNSESLTIVADLSGALTSGAQLDNTVSLSADASTTASSSEETTVNREVDLVVAKSLGTTPVIAGQPISWTVTVDNNGPSTATDVVLTDILPVGLTNITTSPGPLTCDAAGAVVLCNWSEVASGDSVSVTINANVAAWVTTSTDVTNGAVVTATETELNEADNATTTPGVTTRSVDVSMTKTAQAATISAGTPAVWTLQVSNDGPSYASNVRVSDVLPPEVSFDSAASSPACGETAAGSGTVICTHGVLPDGESVEFTIATTTASTLAGDVQLENQASVVTDEPNTSTQTAATGTIAVGTAADLSLTKTLGDPGLQAGLDASYTVVVSNDGPSQATDVVLSDTLPEGLTFNPAASDARCTASATVVTCTIAALENGASESLQLGVSVAPTADGVITNTAQVSSATPDPDQADNNSAVQGSVQRTGSYSLTKQAQDTATQGDNIEWVILATNLGPATGATQIVDRLPEGLALVSATAPSNVTCGEVEGELRCDVPPLGVGESVVVRVTTRATGSGDITNTASVLGDHLSAPPTATETVAVAPGSPSDLAFSGSSTSKMLLVAFSLIGVGGLLVARRGSRFRTTGG